MDTYTPSPWVVASIAYVRRLRAEAPSATPARRAEIDAELAEEYALWEEHKTWVAAFDANMRALVVDWRQQLCTLLAEAEQEQARAQQALNQAKARLHRAFRTDEVRLAQAACREAADTLEEILEKVETFSECIACWTPEGEQTAYAREMVL